jgi:hypothetical protein
MRGDNEQQEGMFSYISHEKRVPRFRHGPTERTSCEPSNFKARVINAKSRIRTRRKVNFQQAASSRLGVCPRIHL